MDDTDIHNGWDKADLRDAFSDWLGEVFTGEKLASERFENALGALTSAGIQRTYDRKVLEIERVQTELRLIKKELSLNFLLEEQGWQYFDVSDYVIKSGDYCRSFIGTEKDHDEFLRALE